MKKNSPESPQRVSARAFVFLLALSLVLSLLALFQWMQLLLVKAGGQSICGIGENVNCEAVWTSRFASGVQRVVGMPIAALGLVYGLTAFAATLLLLWRSQGGRPIGSAVAAVRLTGVVGVAASIVWAAASLQLGTVCLTCLGTYALTIAFAVVGVRMLPGSLKPAPSDVRPALGWTAAFAAVAYLALLGPGLKSPASGPTPLPIVPPAAKADGGQPSANDRKTPLGDFLGGLSSAERQGVADTLALWRAAQPPDMSRFPIRKRYGPADAPVKIVEFTDMRCSHCRTLNDTMHELKRAVPPGSMSVEPRHFPLDAECNKAMEHTDGTGVRCLGAKVQICLEPTAEFWAIRDKLFAEQQSLTRERVLEIGSSGPMSRKELEACVNNPATSQKLAQDIDYALEYDPRGTPLVLVNGVEGSPLQAFLYAMVLARGNPNAPEFAKLPAPRAELHDD